VEHLSEFRDQIAGHVPLENYQQCFEGYSENLLLIRVLISIHRHHSPSGVVLVFIPLSNK
jgi:hypothetical protein